MDRTERFYRIDRMLRERKIVTARAFCEMLGVSHATFKRDLEYMRSRLDAPIDWDRDANGYRLDETRKYALPGLWFNDAEVLALLTMERLLDGVGQGLLSPHVAPLRDRLEKVLGSVDHSAAEVRRRIRILGMAARRPRPGCFETAAAGVLKRRRLRIVHHNRFTDEEVAREVSPQRLVHYRDNWYLDAWCHLREGLRSFGLDAVRGAELLDARAKNVPDSDLDATFAAGYGIFGGAKTQWAKLRFTPARARWVALEQWHPEQKSAFDGDGRYVLELPYSDDRELVSDILRHGPDVEVLAPAELRKRVAEQLRLAARRYEP